MVPLEPEQYGFFCGGDSYVIKYSYNKKLKEGKKSRKESYIIYFWQVYNIFSVYQTVRMVIPILIL